jgi:hypothetical protein
MTLIHARYLTIFENLFITIKIILHAFRLLIAGGKSMIKLKVISYHDYFNYGKGINNLYNLCYKALTRW